MIQPKDTNLVGLFCRYTANFFRLKSGLQAEYLIIGSFPRFDTNNPTKKGAQKSICTPFL
jgi:hypothetical protein